VGRPTNEKRRQQLEVLIRELSEKIKAKEAEITTIEEAGVKSPEAAQRDLKELLGKRDIANAQLKKLRGKLETQAKIVFGAIAIEHFLDHPNEPLPVAKMLEALREDKRTARNSELIGLALLLHRKAGPEGLDEFTKWAQANAGTKPLWIAPRQEVKRQKKVSPPKPAAQEPVKPPESNPEPVLTLQELAERAKTSFRHEGLLKERLKEEWNRTYEQNASLARQQIVALIEERREQAEREAAYISMLRADRARLRGDWQIRNIDLQLSAAIKQQRINHEHFPEEIEPKKFRKQVFEDTKGQRPDLFAQMSALGIAPEENDESYTIFMIRKDGQFSGPFPPSKPSSEFVALV
jgi:hypothetical protein